MDIHTIRVSLMLLFLGASYSSFGYQRAVETADNVKRKLYPREESFEVHANGGMLLNQSYINTTLLNFGFAYHYSKTWGFGLDFAMASNQDRTERFCIENFYNDPNNEIGEDCPQEGAEPEINSAGANTKANYGPAYVPIREIQSIATLNMIWSPIYGKQLFFFNMTSYFDLYLEMGLGSASSRYFPQRTTLRNNRESRGEFKEDGSQPDDNPLGADISQTDSYGVAGRPDPRDENSPIINLGIGQKFHFAGMFHINTSLRNITLLGSGSSLENLFIIYVGLGVRF